MQIHQSAEDYLETILMLNQRMGRVRSIDVVNELGYTKASVSIAMKKLRENGYIAVDGEGNLTLLEPGLSLPVASASSIIFLAIRSLTEPAGLKYSSLARMVAFRSCSFSMWVSSSSGVWPIS